MSTMNLQIAAPNDPAQREAMIRTGLLDAAGNPRPVVVDLGADGGVFDTGGKRLLAPIGPSDVNEAAELPGVLHGYRNGKYRADEAATIAPIAKREFKYRREALANAYQRVSTKTAHDAAIPEIDVSTAVSETEVEDYAIGSFVSLTTEMNEGSTPFRARSAAAKMCANKIMLDREYLFWAMVTTSGNWNANNVQTLNSGTKWNAGATADPIANLRTMMQTSIDQITGIWMNEQVAGDMLAHPSVREHMRQMLGDGAPAPNVTQLLTQIDRGNPYDFVIPGFPPFHVVTGKYTSTAAETATMTALLGAHVVGLRTLPKPPASGEDVASVTTWRWNSGNGTGWQSREFDLPGRTIHGGRMVVVVRSEKDTFTANRVGGLILNAHA